MSHYCFQASKIITVTVEAGSESEALEALTEDIADGEYAYSFDKATPVVTLIHQED